MAMRGVEKTGTTTITSCVLGCFEKKVSSALTRHDYDGEGYVDDA
jgi:GTP cyclohydrolase I